MPPAHVLSACLALGVLTCTQDDGDDDKRPEDGAIAFDAPADAADGDGSDVRCHGTPVPAWTGTAERLSGYSGTDDLVATVRWELVETVGCVDRYQPSGTARYHYAIPGALCHQTTEPATAAIAAGDGTMTIDRSHEPATYRGSGATAWEVTWTCEFDDGTTDTKTVAGGGAWLLDETGSVDGGVIAGDRHAPIPDCHLNDFPECDYHWSFTPAP